ncbi:hypothetical protein B9057_06055 [Aestuarium zhoushanense]|nr:hypothetical protein B9057_02560 [Aestuarium zhoushanense]AUJ63901.1 hypothetical protein B9057_06055 [Aestuarium zhoushanense]
MDQVDALKSVEHFTAAFEAIVQGPTDAEMQAAPVLRNWKCVSADVVRFIGHVAGHPRLGCRDIATSQALFLSEDRCFGRTMSRWYRLEDELSFETVRFGWHSYDAFDTKFLPVILKRMAFDAITVASSHQMTEILERLHDADRIFLPK